MKKFWIFGKIFVFMLICFIICNIGLYIYAYVTPKIPLKTANSIEMYDNQNELLSANIDGNKWVKLEDISKYIIDATITTEDKNFYKHQGFDYLRIISAMASNVKKGNLNQGASTISQQYIKNMYLTFNKTWSRKIEEALLTFELETHYSKDDILEGYLNTINYGGGNYGIENASKYYFNKKALDLTLAEATLIAGIPKNPTQYNPISHFENAKKRQKIVLNSMVKNEKISQEEADKVYSEEVLLLGTKENSKLVSANYFSDAVISELKSLKEIPESLINTGGLKVYTTLDINSQKIMEDNIKNEMAKEEELQVASLAVEPKSGKVLALIGGKDYTKSEFNRVTQAKRQVGSTMKPFLYYAALENGLTPSSTFISEKTTFTLDKDKTYSPQNYGDKYPDKKISMASAIAYSDNIFAVKTHLFLGEEMLVNTAKRVGIKSDLTANASLPLGTSEISMLDYSNGYITLANNGMKVEPYLITKVTDMNDKVIYKRKSQEELVLNSKYSYILNEMLSNTYNYEFVDYTSPTMISIKNLITRKYAVKSGSTDTDYWTVGYNPDCLVMVWNGNDNNTNLQNSQSKISKNIWAKTIEGILQGKEQSWYDIPDGITASIVDPVSGQVATKGKNVPLYYIKGTEPEINENIFNNLFLKDKENKKDQ